MLVGVLPLPDLAAEGVVLDGDRRRVEVGDTENIFSYERAFRICSLAGFCFLGT